jgi:S-adenosylmethionine hydrolase
MTWYAAGSCRVMALAFGHMERSIITLTTDFGTKDGYVGAVKGVVKRINRHAEIIDITHELEPFDVLGAAFALKNSSVCFPRGTVHLAVVDPGVGSERQPLLIKTRDFCFVGPDNGVFSFVYDAENILEIIRLSNRQYFLADVSSTFHARDIFAPVAGYVSLGVDIRQFGAPAKECVKLLIPEPKLTERALTGEVIHIDGFGNLITNIGAELLHKKSVAALSIGRKQIERMSKSYFDMSPGRVGALIGSSGFLEIALNQGNAQRTLKAKVGTRVKVLFS